MPVTIGSRSQSHISEKNIASLSDVVSYLGSAENMARFMREPACRERLGVMAEALRKMYGLGIHEPSPDELHTHVRTHAQVSDSM